MTTRERLAHRRKPSRVQVFAPPVVIDTGRAGWMLGPIVCRTRTRRPRPRRAQFTAFFHTGATPPVPVSGDLRRLLLGVGL